MRISKFAAACLSVVQAITPKDYAKFVIDFDKPAAERYHAVFTHFEPQLRDMEHYWWNEFYKSEVRDWFEDNIEELRQVQPDSYETNLALAEFLDLSVAQTFGVSSITEISTYCTSIIARNTAGDIAHVRNLDFSYTDVMKQLVYEAHLKKDGEVVAISPSIAGFHGAFTGQRIGAFSISYDVRERDQGPTHDVIFANLKRNLDATRTTEGLAILNSLLNNTSYQEAVDYFSTVPMTSPGHFIIGGLKDNEGTILTRTADLTDHRFELSDSQWYVAITNVDVWKTTDVRYENAVKFLIDLGQDGFEADGKEIIEKVLWRDGVIQLDSIFSAAISAHPGTAVTMYDAPSENEAYLTHLIQALFLQA